MGENTKGAALGLSPSAPRRCSRACCSVRPTAHPIPPAAWPTDGAAATLERLVPVHEAFALAGHSFLMTSSTNSTALTADCCAVGVWKTTKRRQSLEILFRGFPRECLLLSHTGAVSAPRAWSGLSTCGPRASVAFAAVRWTTCWRWFSAGAESAPKASSCSCSVFYKSLVCMLAAGFETQDQLDEKKEQRAHGPLSQPRGRRAPP